MKMTKKIFALCLSLILVLGVLPIGASAEYYGGLQYEELGDGTLEITECDSELSGDLTLPSTIYGKKVTSIGSLAFADCDSLTNVTIPDSVTYIANHAFVNCDSLTNVTIPDSVTYVGDRAFAGCYSLTNINIPEGVTYIGESVFEDCSGLTNINIAASVEYIGEDAFRWCYDLESIDVSLNNPNYSSDEYGVLFNKDKTELIQYPAGNTAENYSVPEGVTYIGDSAFENCSNLTNITIPEGVTRIGHRAFYLCESLTRINVPGSVEYIGYGAFRYCDKLQSIDVSPNNLYYSSDEYGVFFNKDKTELIQYPVGNTAEIYSIPDSVTTIDESAFEDCINLTTITIPDCVTSIGDETFANCDSLTNITIPGSVTYIGKAVFYDCESLTSVTILEGVTYIGDYAFEGCSSLTNMTIPESVTYIGEGAFFDCESLTSINIPESVTYIDDYAFANTSLKDIALSENVTYIEDGAFDTESLEKITFYNPVCQIYSNEYTIHPESAVIYGYKDSTAQAYAEKYGREFKLIDEYTHTETKENKETGISITYGDDIFDGDVELEVTENPNGTQLVDNSYSKLISWDITLKVDGKEVQPTKPVLVKIPVPAGFDRNSIAVYHIDTATGKSERMKITIDGDYISFFASSFSPYVVVDESTKQTEPEPCTCYCHKSGIKNFFWKIANFFRRLFRMNKYKTCACGKAHW